MSAGDKAVFFNGVPLLVLAALYLVLALAAAPPFLRERGRASLLDWVIPLLLPCVGLPAAVYGAEIVHSRQPIGATVWPAFAATLVAYVPAVLLLVRWNDRKLVATGFLRARVAEERASVRDRELESVASVSSALARAHTLESAGRLVVQEACRIFSVEYASLVLVDDAAQQGSGLVAARDGVEVPWWPAMRLDLVNEPSGVASACFEAAPVVVYDAEGSPKVNRRLVVETGVKSAVFVPLISEARVIAVLSIGATHARRAFTGDELALLQALAGEAALALERTRSAAALEKALERERLTASIASRVRSELDLAELLRVAVVEVGRALGLSRCFIRLGEAGQTLRIGAEWAADGVAPIGEHAPQLPAANLALRERRTVVVTDAASAPELEDRSLGGREVLAALGTGAVLAVPVIVLDELIGVLGLHRGAPSDWSEGEQGLAEAVARELGLAIHTARLLGQNQQRLEQQTALVNAAQVVTSELQLGTVLQRLVEEVTKLLAVEAADCYLYDPELNMLRCAAAEGLDPDLVGFELEAGSGAAGRALKERQPVIARYGERDEPVQHPAYAGFVTAIVAPMTWSGELRGVLGAGSRDPARVFTPGDADLLEGLASLASLALRNAQSFEQHARRVQLQRGFYRIASVLGESLSMPETLDAVAQAATEALGAGFAAVLMPGAGALELAGSHALPGPLAAALAGGLPASAAAVASAAGDGRMLAAREVDSDERFGHEWRALAAEAGFASLVAIPVEVPREATRGVVIVFFPEERPFADEDLELADHLSQAARGALERSALFEAERSSRALSQQLARTGSLLATELDPAAVLEEVAAQAPALLGVEASSIRLLEGDELVVRAATGPGAEAVTGIRGPVGRPPAGDVIVTRAPVAVGDVSQDRRLLEEPLLARDYRAYLGVPLFGAEEGLRGVLAVYDRRARTWRDEEVDALAALAANASAVLSNAELYQRVAFEKERSFAILANVADGIVAVDREGKVVLWNSAAEKITGVPTSEAAGRTIVQVLQRPLESDGDAPLGDRLVPIARAGREIWLSVTEAIMRDPAGAVSGRILAFRDISAELAVENMKSDFVSTVSHELRTPLTSIYGFAATLLRADVQFGEEERRTFIGYIASESERLTNIVDALLNVARLDSGDLQVDRSEFDVRPVVSEAVAGVEHAAPSNGHRFVVDLPEEPLATEADPEKVRQILGNLIDNAVKFSPAGGTVTVTARRSGDAVEVRVADEGIGIPEGEQERIFAKFYRGGAPDGVAGAGTGLGLFIARGLVSAMGGRMWVSSAEGGGSCFFFELPRAERPGAGGDA